MSITSTPERIVEGSQKFVEFKFNMSHDWDGMAVFAQFEQDGTAYNLFLDNDNAVTLPPEIKAGECTMVLYGVKDDIKATTNYILLGIDKNILVENAESIEITQSLYDQMIQYIHDNIYSTTEEIITKFVTEGVFSKIVIPDGSIERKKLDDDVIEALGKAEAAAPANNVYTKAQVDDMFDGVSGDVATAYLKVDDFISFTNPEMYEVVDGEPVTRAVTDIFNKFSVTYKTSRIVITDRKSALPENYISVPIARFITNQSTGGIGLIYSIVSGDYRYTVNLSSATVTASRKEISQGGGGGGGEGGTETVIIKAESDKKIEETIPADIVSTFTHNGDSISGRDAAALIFSSYSEGKDVILEISALVSIGTRAKYSYRIAGYSEGVTTDSVILEASNTVLQENGIYRRTVSSSVLLWLSFFRNNAEGSYSLDMGYRVSHEAAFIKIKTDSFATMVEGGISNIYVNDGTTRTDKQITSDQLYSELTADATSAVIEIFDNISTDRVYAYPEAKNTASDNKSVSCVFEYDGDKYRLTVRFGDLPTIEKISSGGGGGGDATILTGEVTVSVIPISREDGWSGWKLNGQSSNENAVCGAIYNAFTAGSSVSLIAYDTFDDGQGVIFTPVAYEDNTIYMRGGTVDPHDEYILSIVNNNGSFSIDNHEIKLLLTSAEASVSGKADAVHTHEIAQVNGLDGYINQFIEALEDKSEVGHKHVLSDVTGAVSAATVESMIERSKEDDTQFKNETNARLEWLEADVEGIPSKTSDLTNDSGFISDVDKVEVDLVSIVGALDTSANVPTCNAVSTAIANKADKYAQVTSGTDITLADNTEYRLSNVTSLNITYPTGNFEVWMRIGVASEGTVTITLPASQYIGDAPAFANGEIWEMSIKDGVIIANKVTV